MSDMLSGLTLATTGRTTSRLGFGCAHLIARAGLRASLRLLDCAYDMGIRHFDVAPMYGFGQAEQCLGQFLRRHRDHVTVATKFGLLGGGRRRWTRLARVITRPIRGGLRRIGASDRPTAPASDVVRRPLFTTAEAAASLEASLRALRTDHIDLFLLHEVDVAVLNDDDVLRFEQDAVRAGKIGAFGVGTDAGNVVRLVAERPAYCQVVQCQWSVLDAVIGPTPYFRLHYGSLTRDVSTLHRAVVGVDGGTKTWSSRVGYDLADERAFVSLLIGASLAMNPASIVLYSSLKTDRLRLACDAAKDARLSRAGETLYQLISQAGLGRSSCRD